MLRFFSTWGEDEFQFNKCRNTNGQRLVWYNLKGSRLHTEPMLDVKRCADRRRARVSESTGVPPLAMEVAKVPPRECSDPLRVARTPGELRDRNTGAANTGPARRGRQRPRQFWRSWINKTHGHTVESRTAMRTNLATEPKMKRGNGSCVGKKLDRGQMDKTHTRLPVGGSQP